MKWTNLAAKCLRPPRTNQNFRNGLLDCNKWFMQKVMARKKGKYFWNVEVVSEGWEKGMRENNQGYLEEHRSVLKYGNVFENSSAITKISSKEVNKHVWIACYVTYLVIIGINRSEDLFNYIKKRYATKAALMNTYSDNGNGRNLWTKQFVSMILKPTTSEMKVLTNFIQPY